MTTRPASIRHFMELTALDDQTTRLLCIAAGPAASFARMHDMRWSQAIEERFN